MMTNGDPKGRIFYPTLTRQIDYFSCTPINTVFSCLKRLQEVPEIAEMRNGMMALFFHNNDSIDDNVA